MTLGTFRNMLAGYMGRDAGTFVVNNVNLLDRAINQARKWAERQHRFECARESVVIRGVSGTDGAALSQAVLITDEDTSVSVRTIERAYLPFPSGEGQFEIEVWSRDADMRDVGRRYKGLENTDSTTQPSSVNNGPMRLVRHNDLVYVSPRWTGAATRDVFMDVVKWMEDYVQEDDTDFFLDHCEDFMLLRGVAQLNFMLKEDQRVNISAAAMSQSWETVLKVDNDAVTGASDDANLD